MAAHERFNLRSVDDLKERAASLGLTIPLAGNVSVLSSPVPFGSRTAPNRLVVHPMEGCDGTPDGRPGELTIRRYERFATGGAGLIWVEATAVVEEGRANPRQLLLVRRNLSAFRELVRLIERAAAASMGEGFRPVIVLQLTHSGRYSKPSGRPEPMIAHHSPLDGSSSVAADLPVVSDEYLDGLQDAYVQAAQLAGEAGFDAVDVKACHRYLVNELLASHTREGSRFGGSFECRTRFLLDVFDAVRGEVPGIELATRLSCYDALPYPYGWGMAQDGGMQADLSEPQRLVAMLAERGCQAVSVTIGNPYYQPHFGRPFDTPVKGGLVPEEHPLEGVARFIEITRQMQQAFPRLTVIGAGYSWLRHLFPHVATAVVEKGWASMVGLGRGAFAYPDFARDILRSGELDPERVCIACSGCSQIMRDGGTTGCIVRDAEVYLPVYRECRARARGEVNR